METADARSNTDRERSAARIQAALSQASVPGQPGYDMPVDAPKSQEEHNLAMSSVIEALTDLRHFCAKYGLTFTDLDRYAHEHYLRETEPD